MRKGVGIEATGETEQTQMGVAKAHVTVEPPKSLLYDIIIALLRCLLNESY